MQINQSFLPPDAMLARYMLPSCVRPSVCLSQAGVLLKRLGELSWNLGFLPSIPLCVIKKAGYQKIKVFPSSLWGFVPNSGLGKFRPGKSIALSTKLVVVVNGRACWRHLHYSRRVVAVYYKSINCNALTPLLRFVYLLYNLFLQLTRFWPT